MIRGDANSAFKLSFAQPCAAHARLLAIIGGTSFFGLASLRLRSGSGPPYFVIPACFGGIQWVQAAKMLNRAGFYRMLCDHCRNHHAQYPDWPVLAPSRLL